MTPDLKAPEGCVILGYGGTFKVPGKSRQKIRCWAYNEKIGSRWMEGYWWVDDPEYIFAAPADSEVVRMNSPEKSEGSETPRTDALWSRNRGSESLLKHARTLERELSQKAYHLTLTEEDLKESQDHFHEYKMEVEFELASKDALISDLRSIFPAICEALGNGACCTGDNSIEFLREIPKEVGLVIKGKDALIGKYETALRLISRQRQNRYESTAGIVANIADAALRRADGKEGEKV